MGRDSEKGHLKGFRTSPEFKPFFGILALGYAGFDFAASHAYQVLEIKKFKQAGFLSEPHILVEGDVIGEIQVPRLGLDAIVVQGDSRDSLRRAVGHIANSALPGEWGNVALPVTGTLFSVRFAIFDWATKLDSRLGSAASTIVWNQLKSLRLHRPASWNRRPVTT
jgi:hypothetical protein